MKPTTNIRSQRACVLAVQAAIATLCAGTLWPLAATAQQALTTATASVRPDELVTLNFANAEIEAVARTMATITGRNVVVDPRVKGTLNLVTERAVRPAVAFDQFLAALRLQGFTVVESAGLYKVVPEADAKLQGSAVTVSQGGATPRASVTGNQIVTQIFKLNYENAANLVPVLRPLISPNNTINANPGNNTLVITDYADNLNRIARIVAAMDVSNATGVEVITLRYAIATDLAPLVQKLVDGSAATSTPTAAAPTGTAAAATPAAAGGSGDVFRTTLLAEPRSNTLIVRAANPARLALVRSLVDRLDQPSSNAADTAAGNIHVVYLKNADATQLAATLRAALAADPGFAGNSNSNSAGGASSAGSTSAISAGTNVATGLGSTTGSSISSTASRSTSGGLGSGSATTSGLTASSAQPSTGGQIQADPSTNALIISAPAPQYRQLRAVIDQLDVRRAQLYVEALIAEVTADNATDLGVQWLGLAGSSSSGYIGAGTNYGTTGNLFAIAASKALGTTTGYTYSQGLNIGFYKGSLGLLASALETKSNTNILSTPTLLTLDNQEAKIMIGKNVPIATGSYTSTTSSTYSTYERMDVGLTLNIKPQINADGTIKLQIYQEVSSISGSLDSSTTTTSSNLVTNKRSVASTVLVQDGYTAVLGGLISDEYDGSTSQVPVLGSLPYIGPLFRSQSRSRSKTNLMIFLRPTILRDNQSMDRLMLDRYDNIRSLQTQSQPEQSSVLRVNMSPVLPAVQPGSSGQGVPPALLPSAYPDSAAPQAQPAATEPSSTTP
ncbi:type II secretion system secretin GspD [Xylophilus sp.]|uniref:type II secretion system secretin GspD n=1 Tax=Xylophilus sp. TaxID=2653893 RepID=UPI0013B9D853|nr:type II secretion system secretin GspD [Xylophilus sp.]KAF1049820.1 MAG: Type II secretion system protein D [Xylophilus sp.]